MLDRVVAVVERTNSRWHSSFRDHFCLVFFSSCLSRRTDGLLDAARHSECLCIPKLLKKKQKRIRSSRRVERESEKKQVFFRWKNIVSFDHTCREGKKKRKKVQRREFIDALGSNKSALRAHQNAEHEELLFLEEYSCDSRRFELLEPCGIAELKSPPVRVIVVDVVVVVGGGDVQPVRSHRRLLRRWGDGGGFRARFACSRRCPSF